MDGGLPVNGRVLKVWAAALALACWGCAGTTGGGDGTGGPPFDGGSDGPANGGSGTGGRASPSGSGGSAAAGTGGSMGSGGASAGAGGRGGSSGLGGQSAGSGGRAGSAGAGGGAMSPCSVSIALVSPQPEDALEAVPGLKVQVRGSLRNPAFDAGASLDWKWSVAPASGAIAATAVNRVEMDPSWVEFAAEAGTYTIQVMVQQVGTTRSCSGWKSLAVASALSTEWSFRVTPPTDSGLPSKLVRYPAQAPPEAIITLDPGRLVTIAPKQIGGSMSVVPAYVRVSLANSPIRFEGHTAAGPVRVPLLELISYDVLIVPDGKGVAPALAMISTLAPGLPDLDMGLPVSGQVLDRAGNPVAGAQVILRSGALSSTISVTDADGNYVIRARPGNFHVSVTAPTGTALPEARTSGFGDAMGPVLVSQPIAPDVSFRWQMPATLAVSIDVKDPTSAPVANAAVYLRAMGPSQVGTFVVNGVSATGSLPGLATTPRRAVTDAQGRATFQAPAGPYEVTVYPPSDMPVGSVTEAFNVTANQVRPISLPERLVIAGTLAPSAGWAGAIVTAEATRAYVPVAPAKAVADASGNFSLTVDPGQSYRIIVEPRPGVPFARSIVKTWKREDGPSLGALTVPAARAVAGTVRRADGPVMPGTLVEVFCVGGLATCPDRSFSFARAVSGTDGTFSLMLPVLTP